jgi:threonine/homoserine/homoserine lactone efflux protein
MEINYLFKGLILGFSIAAPVGPIGVLCIRRTITDGRLAGLLSGLGAASADAIYGSIAGFGITYISNFLVSQQFFFRLLGGIFLFYLGVKSLFATPPKMIDHLPNKSLPEIYLTTFLLTLMNPMTILSFAAIFSGLGFVGSGISNFSAIQLVLGVFVGSAFWWLLLSSLVSGLRSKFNVPAMQWVNRISGLLIIGFGISILISLF